jgi:cytochrome c553
VSAAALDRAKRLMHNVVERLVDADMVAIAAYVASLQP